MRSQSVLSRRLGRNVLLVAGAAVLAACVPLKPTPSTPPAEQPHGTTTFNCTQGQETWTVPAGVTTVTVHAFGAEGGLSAIAVANGAPVAGKGGEIEATVSVTPGQVMLIEVGCEGGDASLVTGDPGLGGYGGGTGGDGASAPNDGGGGGGASTFRLSGGAILVAAGAGGGSGNSPCTSTPGAGGHGGGFDGLPGERGDDSLEATPCDGSANSGGGGGAGTQSTPGDNGAPSPTANDLATAGNGTNGGAGGPSTNGGGGGGGGYFGGGGGGAGGSSATFAGAGGGGGGSSFAIAAATGVTTNTGVRSGNGELTLTW